MSKKSAYTTRFELNPDNMPALTEDQQKELEALAAHPASDIDYSDIPPATDIGGFYRPIKKMRLYLEQHGLHSFPLSILLLGTLHTLVGSLCTYEHDPGTNALLLYDIPYRVQVCAVRRVDNHVSSHIELFS